MSDWTLIEMILSELRMRYPNKKNIRVEAWVNIMLPSILYVKYSYLVLSLFRVKEETVISSLKIGLYLIEKDYEENKDKYHERYLFWKNTFEGINRGRERRTKGGKTIRKQ